MAPSRPASASDPPATPGVLLIISGPSGVGKTTIARAVQSELDAVFSVSMTTRPRTDAETPGVDYHFVDDPEFARQREAGQLLEWAQVFDHCYGTPRQPVLENLAAGRIVLLEIDVQGAIQVKANMPDAFAVFILPPSEQTLLDRLRQRKREDEATIQRRFTKAKDEIARARVSGVYDAFIVNDNLDEAITQTLDTIRRELDARRGKIATDEHR